MDSVKIGSIVFDIQEDEKHVVDPDNEGVIGRYSFSDSRFWILKTMSDRNKRQTLWHEIFHVISDQRNLDLGEGEIDALAHAMVDLIEANQGVLS